MSESRWRLVVLGLCTALAVPLSLYFMWILNWVFPARNGYPVCDPEHQPWCEYDPTVTVRWYAGVACGVVALLCLVVAYALPKRFRFWWAWAFTPLVLLPVGVGFLGSLY
ncbi:hypothetical protein AB0F81_48915 [Actinoplanes sp. NPDC024001]|uniref:hypothetical protein n=1 Tax=Actinoplanes sp. NPDC024001 TaxID=3154598 RepID=UPI0033F1ACC7